MIELRRINSGKIGVLDGQDLLGIGDLPHQALDDAWRRLNADKWKINTRLDHINELCGYSEDLLAKEVKG